MELTRSNRKLLRLAAPAVTTTVLVALGMHWARAAASAATSGAISPDALLALLKLMGAASIGFLITAMQKRDSSEAIMSRPMEQAQILLCIAGALLVMLIGDSLARAIGILGGAAIVRFRTPVDDPKDATILFLLLGLGMAMGLGYFGVAGLAALFLVAGADGPSRVFPASTAEFSTEQTGLGEGLFQHTAVLEDLQPGTQYRYQVRVDGQNTAADGPFSFRTAGVGTFSFLALGDSGTGSAEQIQLAQLMESEPASLLLHTGDIAYPSGSYWNYDRHYLGVYQAMMRRIPFYPCPGNHDHYDHGGEPYRAIHDLPAETVPERDRGLYYSFDWGDVHFIALDSNQPLDEAARGRGAMLQWLEADLARSRAFWRVVYFHHPPYATGHNEGDYLSRLARSLISPILERHSVPLVLNGHEHSFQRTYPIRGSRAAEAARYT